jgi:hypothetical protein
MLLTISFASASCDLMTTPLVVVAVQLFVVLSDAKSRLYFPQTAQRTVKRTHT